MSAFDRYLERCVEEKFGERRQLMKKMQALVDENIQLKKAEEAAAKRILELTKLLFDRRPK